MRIDLQYGEGFLSMDLQGRSIQVLVPASSEANLTISSEVIRAFEKLHKTEGSSRTISRARSISIAADLQKGLGQTEILLGEVLTYFQSLSTLEKVTLVTRSPDVILPEPLGKSQFDMDIRSPSAEKHMQLIGETPSYSTPVLANSEFIESDFRIGLGTIRIDPIFGATGGPVSLVQSVCGEKTVIRNLKLGATKFSQPFDENCAASVDASEIASLLGADCVLDTVTDYEGRLHRVLAGDASEQWKSGIESVRSLAEIHLKRRADIAVVSSGGSIHDSTLADSVHSLLAGYLATEHGGVILLVAECRDGPGYKGLVEGVSEFDSEEALATAAESSFQRGMDHSRLILRVLSSRTIILCSRLRRSLVEERLRCHAVRDPQEGVELARTMIASKPRLAVIPFGTDSMPLPMY